MTEVVDRASWRDGLRSVQDVLAVCTVLDQRAPFLAAQARHRTNRLGAVRWRLAVAGAQGVGKSCMVNALLASPQIPNPPVPVSEQEETRIPLVFRRDLEGITELYEDGDRRIPGPVTMEQVRKRASAVSGIFDRTRYKGLVGLIVQNPGYRTPPHIEVVDLPGVAGNLADVSAWAHKHLLGVGTQCVVFVLSSSQTIDCTEQEANLIRAYGPLMNRVVFVQNVWSGYEDDVEGVRAGNLEFLRKHVGERVDASYVLLDVARAMEEARAGDVSSLDGLLEHVAPLLDNDGEELVREEALRLDSALVEIQRVVESDLALTMGRFEEAAEARRAMDNAIREIAVFGERLRSVLVEESAKASSAMNKDFDEALAAFRASIEEYVTADRTVTRELVEREISRLTGRMTKQVQSSARERMNTLAAAIHAELEQDVNGRAGAKVNVEIGFRAPEIRLEVLRGFVRTLEWAIPKVLGVGAGIAGAGYGAEIGGGIGVIGGPAGMIIGGLIGGLVGWLVGKGASWIAEKTVEKSIAGAQAKAILAAIDERLPEVKAEAHRRLHDSLEEVNAELQRRIAVHLEERREIASSAIPLDAASKHDAERLEEQFRSIAWGRSRLASWLPKGRNHDN